MECSGLTGNSPWSDDFDVGFEAVEGKFESDLVIPFSCAAVRDKAGRVSVRSWRYAGIDKKNYVLATLLICNFNHSTSDDRTSKRCAEEVYVLERGMCQKWNASSGY